MSHHTTNERSGRGEALGLLVAALAALAALSCGNRLKEPHPSSVNAGPAPSRGAFVRVLGTVQDGGFPHAACSGPHCRSARTPSGRRLVSSLSLVLPEPPRVYLFDATPDLREQLDLLEDVRRPPTDGVDRSPVDGVFLTHAHIGHYLGLAFFGFEAIHTSDLDVYCTPSMADFLRSNGPWSLLVERSNIEIRELPPGDTIQLPAGVSVTSIASPHRREYSDTVGFLIEGPRARLLYLPDTDGWDRWDTPLVELLADLDVALLDGTFFSIDELPGRSVASIGHPLITDSMDRLVPTPGGEGTRVLFIHLNHSNPALDPAGEVLRTIRARGFGVASEGQEFPI